MYSIFNRIEARNNVIDDAKWIKKFITNPGIFIVYNFEAMSVRLITIIALAIPFKVWISH